MNVNLWPSTRLTPREQQVVGKVCQGLPIKEIAAELGITYFTVQRHLVAIYEKTGCESLTDLRVRMVIRDTQTEISTLQTRNAALQTQCDELVAHRQRVIDRLGLGELFELTIAEGR